MFWNLNRLPMLLCWKKQFMIILFKFRIAKCTRITKISIKQWFRHNSKIITSILWDGTHFLDYICILCKYSCTTNIYSRQLKLYRIMTKMKVITVKHCWLKMIWPHYFLSLYTILNVKNNKCNKIIRSTIRWTTFFI